MPLNIPPKIAAPILPIRCARTFSSGETSISHARPQGNGQNNPVILDQKSQLLESLKSTLRSGTDMDNNSDSGDLIKIIEQLNNEYDEVRALFKEFDESEGLKVRKIIISMS